MTIKDLINDICKYAIKNNIVDGAIGGLSLYDVNFNQNNIYPLLFVAPSQNHSIKDSTITYRINLYYIDRLLRDRDNNIDIVSYSTSKLQALVNIIKAQDNILSVNKDFTIYNFTDTQKLTDCVAGSYLTLEITVKNELGDCENIVF